MPVQSRKHLMQEMMVAHQRAVERLRKKAMSAPSIR
jgi:hypothetical protein